MVEAGSREEIEERALPFKVGEEVLVKIEEPHMYNADDAVARVDSYIVSVTGGGRFVGERKLVRIESVERSAAVASLLGRRVGNGAGDGDGDDGAELESAALAQARRGRRGGRGRSRANAEPAERTTDEHVRSRRERWQAVQVEKGTHPARRPPDAEERAPRSTLRPVMFRDKEVVADAEGAGEGQGRGDRRRAPARARRSRSSSTSRRRATGAAPATAPS